MLAERRRVQSLAIGLLATVPGLANATIVQHVIDYTFTTSVAGGHVAFDFTDGSVTPGGPVPPLGMRLIPANDGGVMEVQFLSGSGGGVVITTGSPTLLAENYSVGAIIDGTIPEDTTSLPGFSTQDGTGTGRIRYFGTGNLASGERGFLGMRFQGGAFYGWAEVSAIDSTSITVYQIAYEDTGAPITVGGGQLLGLWAEPQASIPSGWIAQGFAADRFIYGADAGAEPLSLGGSATHSHTVNPPNTRTGNNFNDLANRNLTAGLNVADSPHRHWVDFPAVSSGTGATLPDHVAKLGLISGNFTTVVPGLIAMWSGPLADIPSGWALQDSLAALSGFNLDFGQSFTGLPNTYGAASGQTGTWVDVPLGVTNGLTNTGGGTTGVAITTTGSEDAFNPATTTDGTLLRDSILNDISVFPIAAFSATLTGLADGEYTVHYYHFSPTSGLTANGTPMNDLAGGSADSLGAQGTNWDVVRVTVSGGTLQIVDTTPEDLAGLSGIQIRGVDLGDRLLMGTALDEIPSVIDNVNTHTATMTRTTSGTPTATVPRRGVAAQQAAHPNHTHDWLFEFTTAHAAARPPYVELAFIERTGPPVPVHPGVIVMWSGPMSEIPPGWVLCDGTNGTPDLRNRFVLGTSGGEEPGATGGSSTHTHLADPQPETGSFASSDVAQGLGATNIAGVAHVHSLDIPEFETGPGTSIPPHVRLAFVMSQPDPDPTSVAEGIGAASGLALHAVGPNPLNPATTIRFDMARRSRVELVIYDAAGRRVRSLISSPMEAGSHELRWNGRNDSGESVAAGIYFMRLTAGENEVTRKLTVLR